MNSKQNMIVNNSILDYLEIRHVVQALKDCQEHINFTLNIILMNEGEMSLKVGNKHYLIHKNSIFIINPFEPHKCIKTIPDTNYYVISISFEWFQFLEQGVLSKNLFFQSITRHYISDDALFAKLTDICNKVLSNNKSKISLHFNINSLLINIIEKYVEKIGNNNHDKLKVIENVFVYIQKNYNAHIDLKKLSKKINTTPEKLAKIFKVHFGIPPYKFIVSYRLYMAKKLLAENYSILDVALNVGFYDQSHFHNQFKKHFGITPRQYIRSLD